MPDPRRGRPPVTTPPRRPRCAALLRGRFRTVFFSGLLALCLLTAHPAAAAAAGAALLAAFVSMRRAGRRGDGTALTAVAVDWLAMGLVAGLSGGAGSWLLLALPLLVMGELAPSPRGDWPYFVTPALLMIIVIAIVDPGMGGSPATVLLKIGVLVTGGVLAAARLQRGGQRQVRTVTVDCSTGLYTARRLRPLLHERMDAALTAHEPLGLVRVRLDHFEDTRNFLGAEGCEELVRTVARRIGHHLRPDDLAFRVAADEFVLVLPDTGLGAARELGDTLAREVASNLIARQRQTLSVGAASFPTVRALDDLLAAAAVSADARAGDTAAPAALPVAAAR